MYQKEYYIKLQKKFHPSDVKTVFILESHPISGLYFYDTTGSTGEPLFTAMMNLYGEKPRNKEEGLRLFSERGCLLVDATYSPVNQLKGKERNEKILEDFEGLVSDLESLGDKRKLDFILIKANICRLLEPRLVSLGFNIKNKGVVIPFPSTGQQTKFYQQIKKVYPY